MDELNFTLERIESGILGILDEALEVAKACDAVVREKEAELAQMSAAEARGSQSPKETSEAAHAWIGQYFATTHQYARLSRLAGLGLIYGAFEVQLHDFATAMRHRASLTLQVQDLSGRGIQRARNYLTRAVGLAPPNEALWEEIQLIGQVRNAAMHNRGSANSNELRRYIAKSPHFELGMFAYIIPAATSFDHVRDLMGKLIADFVANARLRFPDTSEPSGGSS